MGLPVIQPSSHAATPHWDAAQNEAQSFSKICFIPSLGLSCFGCCGHHFKDKPAMHRFFDRNQKTLERFQVQGKTYEQFMNREQLVGPCGGCYSLVRDRDAQGRDQYVCGVHPLRIGKQPGPKGDDLRVGYCEHDYLCKSAAVVNRMTEEEKALFYSFLAEQSYDAFTYSMINSRETLLNELYIAWKQQRERTGVGGKMPFDLSAAAQ